MVILWGLSMPDKTIPVRMVLTASENIDSGLSL
jgi:hypothetical protein